MKWKLPIALAVFCIPFAAAKENIRACPLCDALGAQTLSEQIQTMDVVVIAQLMDTIKVRTEGIDGAPTEIPKARFNVSKIVKGAAVLGAEKTIDITFFGDVQKGDAYLLMGVDPPQVSWIAPQRLSPRGRAYIEQVSKLSKNNSVRLLFFQDHLEDADEMIARDAYDEFAKAPYEDISAIKEKLKHDQVVIWIKSSAIPVNRKRLYLMMLSACGNKNDVPMLEQFLTAKDRSVRRALDSMIACYLMLKGPSGMQLIEDQFFKNKETAYTDIYAAIMAMRFMGTEGKIVPRERIVAAIRHLLDRPKLADLIIPDLARWKDWTVVDKLAQLFKDAEKNKTTWVRVPVVNYLKVCPLPKAKELLKELEKIDPDAVRRANTYFPFGGAVEPKRS
ncbi:MAG: hypothetical protein IH991_21610 [Planctomycetes bacterium]|nr:hypothetical protein [Planctomycetota bacterium]